MAEKRARLNLARAAARLAARAGALLPPLALLTDDDRLPNPLAAVRALPRGSMVIVRARDAAHRSDLASAVLDIARMRHLVVLIADDAPLAVRLGTDGLHLPEACAKDAAHWRALHPRWLITAASHGTTPVPAAVDAILLSSVFATKSHPERPHLGLVRAAVIASRFAKPIYALGGIDARNAAQLPQAFAGIAAIGALSA